MITIIIFTILLWLLCGYIGINIIMYVDYNIAAEDNFYKVHDKRDEWFTRFLITLGPPILMFAIVAFTLEYSWFYPFKRLK